jgi:hypothetical protein
MTNSVEIKMTGRGFDVSVAGRTSSFPQMDQALEYAQQRLRRAVELVELSARCE